MTLGNLIQEREERLRQQGYVPKLPPVDIRQSIPVTNNQGQVVNDAPYGIPEDWDYRTSKTGPDNQDLPNGAVGWTPHGEPFYGGNSGFANWARGVSSTIHSPTTGNFSSVADIAARSVNALLGQGEFEGQSLGERAIPALSSGVEAFSTLLKNFGNLGGEEVEKPNIITYTGRAVNEVVKGFVTGIGEFGEEVEQVRGGLIEAAGGELNPMDQALRDSADTDSRAEQFLRTALFAFNPIGWAWDAARALVAPSEGKGERFSEGYNAGRILYSEFLDTGLKEEYIRRFRSGENPYLLAEELQNPFAEFSGELVADVLNFVAPINRLLVRKGIIPARGVTEATKLFNTLDPELQRLDDAFKAGQITDAQFGVEFARQSKLVAQRVADGVAATGSRFGDLTQDSRRIQLANRGGSIVARVAASQVNKPNQLESTMDILRAMGDLHVDDMQKNVHALSVLRDSGLPMSFVHSEAALEFGTVVNRVIGGDANKFLSAVEGAKDAAQLLEKLEPRVLKAIDSLVPSLADRAKDVEKYGALTAKQRVFLGAEKITGSGFYRFNKKAFGSLYIGLNPGVWARNAYQGYTQILIDEGIGALIHSPAAGRTFIQKSLGYVPQWSVEGFGVGEGVAGAGSKINAAIEAGAATQVTASALRRNLRIGYNAIFKEVGPELRRLGMADNDIGLVRRMLGETHDWNAVRKQLVEMHSAGYVDSFKQFEFMTEALEKKLGDFGGLEAYKATVRDAETAEDAIRLTDEFFKTNYEDVARQAANTWALPSDMVDNALALADEAALEGQIFDSGKKLNEYVRVVNQNVEDGFLGMLDDMDTVGKHLGINTDDIYTRAAERLGIDDAMPLREALTRDGGKPLIVQQRESYNQYADAVVARYKELRKDADLEGIARMVGVSVENFPQGGMTLDSLNQYFWNAWWFPNERRFFSQARDAYAQIAQAVLDEARNVDPRLVNGDKMVSTTKDLGEALLWDDAAVSALTNMGVAGAGSEVDAIRRLAILNGVATKAPSGAKLDQLLVNVIKSHLPEGAFDDITQPGALDLARQAFAARAETQGVEFVDNLGELTVGERFGEMIPPWAASDGAPDFSRVIAEQLSGIRGMKDELVEGINSSFGNVRPIFHDANAERLVQRADDLIAPRIEPAKLVAEQAAKASRDFSVLDYVSGRTNLDTVLSIVYPYHFWYRGTYTNWIKRVASNPGTVAAYAKYRDTLAEIHAGAPDWWKYNVNSNELFGLDSENPLYFNLEATLNPLNALTGVDFNDPYKRVNMWTAVLDDIGKVGPSPYTFFSIATALALHMRGEEDAASRWAGRLIPQTQAIQAGGNLLGMDPFEIDPFVSLFSNGVDPYTRTRVGRSLSQMVLNGTITQDQAIDAAQSQQGEVWTEALRIAINQRAPGQVASFFMGVGFKGRNVGDIQSDQFYQKFFRLMNARDTMSTQEFRQQMDGLHDQFPFMDALLISRKAGPERDTALAYNVLGRIPPGGSSLTESIGMDKRLIDMFYETKGDLEGWAATDSDRFMAGIVDLMGILATPANATRAEWTDVRNLYSGMKEAMQSRFGEDILDRVDQFYALNAQSSEAGQAYLDENPLVEQALDDRSRIIAQTPLLATYYGGYDAVERYYKSLMFNEIEQEMGDIWTKFRNNTATPAEQKRYAQIRDAWQEEIDTAVLRIGDALPERQGPQVRPDLPEQLSLSQQDLLQTFEPATVSERQLISALGVTGYEILQDFMFTGSPMPPSVRRDIEDLAEELGMSYFGLLNVLRGSLIVQ